MTANGKNMPSSLSIEDGEPEKKRKKSFVRVSKPKRKTGESKLRYGDSPQKQEVIEPEVIDDRHWDEESESDADDDDAIEPDIIDVDDLSHFPATDEDGEGRNLPARASETALAKQRDDEDEFEEAQASDEKGLVVSSALQRYLAEIRKYSLLTIEEEREVAMKAYEQHDVQARNRLITANLRLVVKIAMEYRRAYSQILDLIQEGNAGLVQAVNRFNPYKGVKMSTYSAWWIRAYILKFLMDNKSLVRMGTTEAQRKLFFRLRSEAEKMYALTQRFDANLLAESIGVKEQDVVEMQQRLTKNDVSLDAPIGEEGDTRQVDSLVADNEEPDKAYERNQMMKLLRVQVAEVEKDLNDRDKFIFRERIMAEEPITLQDVGDKFGITRERARQLEARVLKKIKDKLIAAGLAP
jgi:RNA polymerase sigma-32 factor